MKIRLEVEIEATPDSPAMLQYMDKIRVSVRTAVESALNNARNTGYTHPLENTLHLSKATVKLVGGPLSEVLNPLP